MKLGAAPQRMARRAGRVPDPFVIAAVGVAAALGVTVSQVAAIRALLVVSAFVIGVLTVAWFGFRPTDARDRRWVIALTSASFLAHLVLGIVITSSPGLVDYLGSDAIAYDRIAWDITRHWQEGYPMPALSAGKEGFPFSLAGIYYVVGHQVVGGIVFNAGCAAALVFVVSDTTRRLFGRSAARCAALLVVVLPGFLLWPSQLLREAAILLLIALAANLAVRLTSRMQLVTFTLLGVSLALLFSYRSNVALLLLVGLMVGLVISRRSLVSGISVAAGTIAVVAAVVLVVGVGYAGYRFSSEADLEDVQWLRSGLATNAETGFGESVDATSPGELVVHLPEAALLFMVGPFPWQIRSSEQLPLLVDSVVVLALVPSFVRGLRAGRRVAGRRTFVLLTSAALLLVMLSLLLANFGTVARERPQVVVLLLPFVAYGWTLRPSARRRGDSATGTGDRDLAHADQGRVAI